MPSGTDRKHRGARWRAAVLVMLGVPAAGLVLVAQQQLQVISLERDVAASRERADRSERMVQILGSQQLLVRTMTPAPSQADARAVLYLDASSSAGLLTVRRVSWAYGRALQLWFGRGDQWVSGGLVWPDGSGNGAGPISVPADLDTFNFVSVTGEPPTGSEAPTTAPLFDSPLNAADVGPP
jgi:Anti-sigma-K factor rskA